MAVAKDGFPTHSGWPWTEPTSHTNLVQQPVQSWKEAAPQLGFSPFPINSLTAMRLAIARIAAFLSGNKLNFRC